MQPILSFDDLTLHLQRLHRTFRLAVVCGSDPSTAEAVMRAVSNGFADATFVGACHQVRQQACVKNYEGERVHFIEADTDVEAAQLAVSMVKRGEADVLMKGLIHTDTLLHAVLNKEWGILPRGQVLTHIAMAQMPSYHKLLFFTDAAVIPYPTHEQRAQQVAYLARMLHAFGIDEPRISLIHCAETANPKFPHTMGYGEICQRAAQGEWGRLLVDGPLDLRTSCDAEALRVKAYSQSSEAKPMPSCCPTSKPPTCFTKVFPSSPKPKWLAHSKAPWHLLCSPHAATMPMPNTTVWHLPQ